jgi:hypothetical protein
MKPKIINILIAHILLFSLIGCDYDYEGASWQLEIANNLSYPISVHVIDKNNSRKTLNLIQPNRTTSIWFSSKTPTNANEGLRKISVFSENKRMLMLLEGEQLNQYVFQKGNDIDDILEGRDPTPIFSFEVKEEHLDINLYNAINFEEPNNSEDIDIEDD